MANKFIALGLGFLVIAIIGIDMVFVYQLLRSLTVAGIVIGTAMGVGLIMILVGGVIVVLTECRDTEDRRGKKVNPD